ncbi:hypothetical protein Bca4012_096708 [Brassica carinata]
MSLGCYYYFDEYSFSSTEDLYGKYKNISGPPIYDIYGEDVMIVEPMDFVFREGAFKTMHAYVKDFMGSINNGTLRSNGGAHNLEQSNSRFEDYMDNMAFEKMSSKQYSTRHHDEEQEDLKSPIKSSKRQRNAEEHKDLRSFNLTLTLLKLEKFDVQDRKWAIFIV